MDHFGVFVLTIDDNFGYSLLHEVLTGWQNAEVIIVRGFKPHEIGCDLECPGHGPGHQLSCVEFAVAEGHRRMRNEARNSHFDLNLFLEDDAILNCTLGELDSLFHIFSEFEKDKDGACLHLFPEQNGLLVETFEPTLLKVLLVPDYAVAYVLNMRALNLTARFDSKASVEVADWPKYLRRLKWYASSHSFVTHPDIRAANVRSLTQSQRNNRHGSKTWMNKYLDINSYRGPFLTILRLFGMALGHQPIEAEKLRSAVVNFHKGVLR